MKCPFITGKYILSCTAHENAEVYVPSLFELEAYCKNIRHTRCPLRHKTYGVRQAGDNQADNTMSLRW